MNLSMKWLSDYVTINPTPREFAEALTMSGSKVEGYTVEGEEVSKVVVGKILSVEGHPNADKLVVCQVDVGNETIQIVTGADNVFPGAMVPVALSGSTLPGGVKIKKGKLRGVESNGMMCSLSELNLTVHDFPYAIEDGIFILQEDCAPGDDIRDAVGLNDTCVEFEITSNRPDCLSVIGLARETAATYRVPLTLKAPQVQHESGDIGDLIRVEVQNSQLCQRYVARAIKNVKIAPSPRWMRERLRASGVRPINNLVDITNYVMLEYGQPMHAFDLNDVSGGTIIVRNARENESIITLDGVERKLSPEMLIIADESKPSAVAGVMGGENSGIKGDTNTVIFESACFSGVSVRRTAKKIGLRTESSSRFEKGLDPANCVPAIQRACELVELLGAGEVVGGCIDIDNSSHEPRRIPYDYAWINRFLGIDLPYEEHVKILEKLEFTFESGDCIVPTFRGDVEGKADLAEEVARFYGYNNIPTVPLGGFAQAGLTGRQKFERSLSQTLLAQGCSEISTYSFMSPKYYDKINLPKDSALRDSLTISNPLGEDTSIMRTTAVPSMLEVLATNYNNRNAAVRFYELATEYIPTTPEKLPVERVKAVVGMYGEDVDFYTLKGAVEALLASCGISGYDVSAVSDNPTFHPGRCAVITLGEAALATLGEIHPAVLENYGIGVRAYVADVDVQALWENQNAERLYRPLPKYPATTRDLALLCDENLPVLSIEKAIRTAAGAILEDVRLFDVFRGKQIESGKKSVAYSFTLRASDHTLTEEEITRAVNKVIKALEALGATLRG